MESLKKERVSVMVTDAIKKMIETEHLKIGDKFYSENQLSKRLGVSRSSIREAIRMLEVTGWVRVFQGKGVFISGPPQEEIPIKRYVVDNTELLREHFEVRLLIEPHIASVAALKAEERDIVAMQEMFSHFCAAVREGNISKAIASDSQFHLLMAKATRNRTLSVLMKTMAETLNEGWYTSLHMPGRLEASIEEHRCVLEAIEKRDAHEASERIKAHLLSALQDIRKHTIDLKK